MDVDIGFKIDTSTTLNNKSDKPDDKSVVVIEVVGGSVADNRLK